MKEVNMSNKKSFVLFKDALSILEDMSDEQAGKFIKLIYHYQLTGMVNTDDFAMKMALAPFINQFKRDEEKYERVCKRNRENGLRGGRPKNPSNPEKPKKPSRLFTNPEKPKKADNDTDNDSDTDSDTDSDNVNIKKKKKKKAYAEFVKLTEEEYQKLLDKEERIVVNKAIQILDNYKGSKGIKYKSDYRAILSWVIDEAKKRLGKNINPKVYKNGKEPLI